MHFNQFLISVIRLLLTFNFIRDIAKFTIGSTPTCTLKESLIYLRDILYGVFNMSCDDVLANCAYVINCKQLE